jgi:hypothetical protein
MQLYFHIWYIAKFHSFSGDDHHFGYITKFSTKKEKKIKTRKLKRVMSSILLLCKGGLQLHYKKNTGQVFMQQVEKRTQEGL